jgi:hypothetical protein
VGLKDAAIEGCATTVRPAVAVVPLPPLDEVTALVTLVYDPAAVPVTFTEMVQVLLPLIDPPERLMALPPAFAVRLPPQLLLRLGGEEITMPAGSGSVNPTPVSVVPVLGLAIEKLSEVELFNGMLEEPNTLLMVDGATTTMLALDVLLCPPCVEVTVTLLFCWPALMPVTLTETVQEEPAAMLPPAKLTMPAPAVAVTVPPQVVVAFGGEATCSPEGSPSVKEIPVRATPLFGFVMLNVSEVEVPSGIAAAPKVWVIEGGLATYRLAVLLAAPVPPLVEVIAPVVL